MKTLKEIAQIVLERRARMSPTVMQGEMVGVLGEEGLQEALTRRWLVPNYESGYLQVSPYENLVVEMQNLAALPEPVIEPDRLGESRVASMQHAFRNHVSLMEANTISEIAAPGTGRPSPGFNSAPPAATPTSSVPPAAPGGAAIGDDVAVVENGKTFQGKIQSGQNGRFRISFGGGQRPADREYSDKEMKRLPPQPGQPGQNAPMQPVR